MQGYSIRWRCLQDGCEAYGEADTMAAAHKAADKHTRTMQHPTSTSMWKVGQPHPLYDSEGSKGSSG